MHSADEEGGLMDSESDDEDRGREPRTDARRRSHSIPQAIEVPVSSSPCYTVLMRLAGRRGIRWFDDQPNVSRAESKHRSKP